MTRAEAKAAGLKRYFTGKPCPKGHVAERGVASKSCLECKNAREATPEARAVRAAYKATPEGRAAKAVWYTTPKGRAAERARKSTPEYRADKATQKARQTAQRQATRAAKILTETLGIPHTVVKMDDGTFQPVPL